jgi:hypothetical protein
MAVVAGQNRKQTQLAARLLRIQFDSGVWIFAVPCPFQISRPIGRFNKHPVRSILSIRFLSIRALVPTAMLLSAMTLAVSPSFSQQAPSGPQAPEQAPTPDTTPGQNPGSAPAPSTAAAPPAKVPDYPDPRGTFTLGIFGLYSPVSAGPSIKGGQTASYSNTYEDLFALGTPYRIVPDFEASLPVTRTGTLYVELQRYHGWNNQTLTRASFIDTFQFNPADVVSDSYHLITARIYLDDLMFPHKFPVARLRFKSIWGLRYISWTDSVGSPTEDAVAGVEGSSFQLGTNYILLPEFGAAMEYAVAPHVLFRVDGAGFGIPHRADLSEGSATLSARKNNLEFLIGVKALHFKTSPYKEEYQSGTFITPFVGLRWHF